MRTEKQRQASRRNGVKSRGPITPASHESHQTLQSQLEATYGAPNHQPDPMIEAAIHAIHSFEQIAALARQRLFHPDASRTQLTARAFRRLADESGILNAIHRFESRSERLFLRAIALLDRRRSENPSASQKPRKTKFAKRTRQLIANNQTPTQTRTRQNPPEPSRTQEIHQNRAIPPANPGQTRQPTAPPRAQKHPSDILMNQRSASALAGNSLRP
jgi:hypothetical protein